MHRYAVFSEDLERANLEEKFGPHVFQLGEGDEASHLWIVATPMATSSDVSDQLGFEPAKMSGVVLKVGEYYGCYDEALWQKLESWSKAQA